MKTLISAALLVALAMPRAHADEGEHSHPPPEKLGTVHFENTCAAAVRESFDRAMALLHSFAYDASAQAFTDVAARDPGCAIAHWGVAMSLYHQLWSPPGAGDLQRGGNELAQARKIGAGSDRERAFVEAASVYFSDADPAHHAQRAGEYAKAMAAVAQRYPQDDEAQIYSALALIATASPQDRTHALQKRAAEILEPIYRRQPDHPGVAHYLIHAYDSSELASRGLAPARAYSKIAPSAPHALHMPSHIFTRLGLWQDSIESNEGARRAARRQGDVGEELHAMDYLTYAYLQRGQDADAERIVADLHGMGAMAAKDFKVGYAATAMPVRLSIERGRWSDAAAIEAMPGALPHVAAIAHWAHALAHAHLGAADRVDADIARIDECETQSRARGDKYWAAQIGVLAKEARAWRAQSTGKTDEAVALLRDAADSEDALEKLPVTPGPIVPAREQLGQLLLTMKKPADALKELTQNLQNAPGRLAGIRAALQAAEDSGNREVAESLRKQLQT